MKIFIRKIHDSIDREFYKNKTHEECLNILEQLRLQAGKFLYEYPARFRRVIKIIRKK